MPYESSRSLFEKFSMINGISPGSLRRLMSEGKHSYDVMHSTGLHLDQEILKRHRNNLGKAHACCNHLASKSIHKSAISRALDKIDRSYRFRAWMLAPSQIGQVTGSMPSCLLAKDRLQYCPQCIAMGYHSIWHQCVLVETCPIHGTALSTSCVGCGSSIFSQNPDWPSRKRCQTCMCHGSIYGEDGSENVGRWLNTYENTDWIKQINDGFHEWNEWYRRLCNSGWDLENISWNGVCQTDDTDYNRRTFFKSIVEVICPTPQSKQSNINLITNEPQPTLRAGTA